MASLILILLNAAQAAFSGYSLYLAFISIRKLQRYEDASKQAAKYSNVAENQLYKTRTTQASAALAVCLPLISTSFLLSLALSLHHTPAFPKPKPLLPAHINPAQVLASFISSATLTTYPLLKDGGLSALVKIAIAAVNIAVLFAAREHVGDFWTGKTKILLPKVGDYNDAITVTQEVRLNMVYLIGSWIGVGFLGQVL